MSAPVWTVIQAETAAARGPALRSPSSASVGKMLSKRNMFMITWRGPHTTCSCLPSPHPASTMQPADQHMAFIHPNMTALQPAATLSMQCMISQRPHRPCEWVYARLRRLQPPQSTNTAAPLHQYRTNRPRLCHPDTQWRGCKAPQMLCAVPAVKPAAPPLSLAHAPSPRQLLHKRIK